MSALLNKMRELQHDIEGKKAEVANTKEQWAEAMRIVSRYKAKYGEELTQIERSTSATSIQPMFAEQEVQVDLPIISPNKHFRTPSYQSNGGISIKENMFFPHTIPLPENTSPHQPLGSAT